MRLGLCIRRTAERAWPQGSRGGCGCQPRAVPARARLLVEEYAGNDFQGISATVHHRERGEDLSLNRAAL